MLKVIGAGLGRTGTHSLAAALEILGLGPCYHMQTFSDHSEHQSVWQAALWGESVDWQDLFAGYNSSVEWPVVSFLKQVQAAFPNAKVVLTLREPKEWYASAAATIFRGLEKSRHDPNPQHQERAGLARQIVLERTFQNQQWNQKAAIECYQRHNAAVRALAPGEKLLEYCITDGWGPLCEFLHLPLPEIEFPRLNERADFLAGEPDWARQIQLHPGEMSSGEDYNC